MQAAPAWRDWMQRRVFKGLDDRSGVIVLRYRRVYIFPTRGGLLFSLMLVVLWLGAINYNNSMLFLLVFLLGGLAIVAILHTFMNLLGLRVTPLPAPPVFAGEPAVFPLRVESRSRRPRIGVSVALGSWLQDSADLAAKSSVQLAFRLPTEHRGWRETERVSLQTSFPTGLFRAWSWLDLRQRCLVYPRPESGAVPLPAGAGGFEQGSHEGSGDEDFRGLRRYQHGDSLKHVAWHAVARGREPQTKQFQGAARSRLWLDWDELSGLDTEQRLSRLCRWVVDAEAAGLRYGLRLPGLEIRPDGGANHRHRCLEALALFGT